jgi:hypothetical protein
MENFQVITVFYRYNKLFNDCTCRHILHFLPMLVVGNFDVGCCKPLLAKLTLPDLDDFLNQR